MLQLYNAPSLNLLLEENNIDRADSSGSQQVFFFAWFSPHPLIFDGHFPMPIFSFILVFHGFLSSDDK